MLYNELLARLQNLINKTPTQGELMQILGIKQSTMSERARRNSKFSPDEIVKLNNHYGINLYTNISENNQKNMSPSTKKLAEALMKDNEPYTKFEDLPYKARVFLLEQYAKGINLNWLVTGQGSMYIKKEPNEEIMKLFEDMIEEKFKERGL